MVFSIFQLSKFKRTINRKIAFIKISSSDVELQASQNGSQKAIFGLDSITQDSSGYAISMLYLLLASLSISGSQGPRIPQNHFSS